MHTKEVLDYIGIGVGPMNLGMACLAKPIENLSGLFFDKIENFNWHAGMLLEGTTLQIPFMADLVTLADPTSEFSFLNYVKEQGRIYSFYIRENFLLLREEYNQYCQWAIQKLNNIHFQTEVVKTCYLKAKDCYEVIVRHTKSYEEKTYRTKKLILGTGTQPYIPAGFRNLNEHAVHSSSYLSQKEALQSKKRITVVGSGQSAAEVFYDLLQDIDIRGYELNWITRSPRFFPLEYSKLTLEMTSPEYVDYFYNLPEAKRDDLIHNQKHLYKGINQELIANIYDLMYTKNVSNQVKINLRTNSEITEAEYDKVLDTFYLNIYQKEQEKAYQHQTEGLILATGYHYQMPKFMKGINDQILWDQKGRYQVQRNYSIDKNKNAVFVQNAELHTHGFVTPDLGMASYRNSYILREITGKDHYKIEKQIAFQQFGVGKEEKIAISQAHT
ncbi:SidA/IucD/PvdA family monooxygenase [Aquimarina sp. ERC-38]|uniref:lysine N(6)-hydroxylase/L-ornithine N(5)-oxygenase family protein n=1 Tax=Aquimarina sp. ERC-38 TaxID=2949996 RepID=UPI0022463594|nr:SidA/IucD/PvdA family monooxygenase [Aquimarina sp. ERC-38]UZO80638.1 SidA/IucD/PvdA family monooxygenase [Aquimarina sp. ERC-38]